MQLVANLEGYSNGYNGVFSYTFTLVIFQINLVIIQINLVIFQINLVILLLINNLFTILQIHLLNLRSRI